MSIERGQDGRIIPGQKSLNPKGRPKKIKVEIDEELLEDLEDDALRSMKRLLMIAKKKNDLDKEERIATKLLPYEAARLAAKQDNENKINEIKIIVEIGNVELDRSDPLFSQVTRSKFDDEYEEESAGRSDSVRSEKVPDDPSHDEESL